ncbi:RNA-directed DNA polymerase, eukaryota, reverse transcriptase zinc-binding domain protein, partial [Tanacetum coccineum]
WYLFQNPNALWVHVVKDIHGDGADSSRPVNAGRTKAEFDALILDIASIEPGDLGVSDSCIWSLSHDNSFSVNSVRKHIDELTLPTLSPCTRWCKANPRNVNIFMWQMFLNRLPIRFNLSSGGLEVDSILCLVCNISVESDIHSFFTFDTASAVWSLSRTCTGSTFPSFSSRGKWDSWF